MVERRLARKFNFRGRRAAQTAIDLVAIRVRGRPRFRKQAFLDQDADPRMIPGLGDDLAAAHQEQAGVAGVRPVGHAVLDETGDAGGAWRVGKLVAFGEVEDGVMGIGHPLLQEAEGIDKGWSGLALKVVGQRLDGDLGGDLAIVMAAHAVRDDHQQGFARVAVAGSVLVVGAPSLAAFLVDRESHRPAFLYFSTTRSSQLDVSSLGTGGVIVSTSAFCSAKTLCGR